MTTRFLLIRHGSHGRLGRVLCGRMGGVSLSDEGRAEAGALARALKRQGGLEAIYSSPLLRARETAEPVGQMLGLPVGIESDLDELDFGAWSGRAFDELADDPLWDYWNRQRDHARPPGGETMLESQVRMVRCLERLCGRHPDADVAVVTHADMIKTALAWGLGLPLALHGRFDISPASVSRMAIGPAEVSVQSINQKFDS